MTPSSAEAGRERLRYQGAKPEYKSAWLSASQTLASCISRVGLGAAATKACYDDYARIYRASLSAEDLPTAQSGYQAEYRRCLEDARDNRDFQLCDAIADHSSSLIFAKFAPTPVPTSPRESAYDELRLAKIEAELDISADLHEIQRLRDEARLARPR